MSENGLESAGLRKRLKQNDEEVLDHDYASVKEHIASIWKEDGENDRDAAFANSLAFLNKQIEVLIREARKQGEQSEAETNQLKETIKKQDIELSRLRNTAEKNTTTLANLLSSADQSRKDAQDTSHQLKLEATLRADLSHMTAERDESTLVAETHKRQVLLLTEDLRNQKQKTSLAIQEKTRAERDLLAHQRSVAAPAARPREDLSYYKRKVSELNSRLHASQTTIVEKSRQIERLEQEISRNAMKARIGNFARDGSHKRSSLS